MQARLCAEKSEYYHHIAVRLDNSEGVRQNAEQSVDYSPQYQGVTWHLLQITRDNKVIDLLPTAKFRKLERELGFEAKIYNGQISDSVVLEDVRTGDILEYAYTLLDLDPLMRGHYSSRNYLGAIYPIQRQTAMARVSVELPLLAQYCRLPPGTQGLPESLFRLSQLRGAMKVEVSDGERIYRWEAKDLPAVPFDQNISPQAAPYYPTWRCSSFTSWSSVVDWAEPLYSNVGPLPDNVKKQIEEWKKPSSTPESRLRAAVDLVQSDIRYFAMAMGSHNIRPRPLRDICLSRFGDCKDKSVLLVALLRELGFEAWPALVNTYSQYMLRDGGPDQFAFNHAIVAYQYAGQLRWVDPTIKQPAGMAGQWALPPYQLALILRPGEVGFTSIPGPDLSRPDTETCDYITFDADTGNAELRTECVVRGLQADYYRQRLEFTAPEETSKNWFNFIARFYRQLEEEEPPTIKDDRESNQIILQAKYRLPRFLQSDATQPTVTVYAYALRALLNAPDSRRRHWPYALPEHRFVRHKIEVTLPFAVPLDQHPQVITTNGMEYRVEKSLSGNRFLAVHDLVFSGDFVPASEMDKFSDAVDEILADLVTGIRKNASPRASSVRWSPKVRHAGSLNPERKERSPCPRNDVSTVPN